MERTSATICLREDKQGDYFRMKLPGRKMKINGRKIKATTYSVLSKIFSFSNREKACLLTYEQIIEEFGYARSTVAIIMDELLKNGVIEVAGRTKNGTAYKLCVKIGGKYIIIPQFLYKLKVNIEEESRFLKESEVIILAYLMHAYKYKNISDSVAKTWEEGYSMRTLAKELSYNEKTIRRAIYSLMKARLIYRPNENKGVNGHKMSHYIVSSELYAYENKCKRRRAKRVSKAISELDKKAERERYYAKLRENAQSRAEKAQEKANKNAEYREIAVSLAKMEKALATAEIFNPADLVVLYDKKNKLLDREAEVLRELKIKKIDLIPQYYCKKCDDTGFIRRGEKEGYACDCYKRE